MLKACRIAALSLLTACTASTQGSGNGKCKTNADCGPDEVCNSHNFCQATFGCHSDSQCGANQTCDTTSGTCLCSNDQGCVSDGGVAEFCNANHRCQSYGACQDNSDCPTGKICDTVNNSCIAASACGGTTQCPLGQICNASNVCVAGCNTSGDCPQTAVNSSGVTYFAPQGCINGQCVPNGCTSTLGCTFENFCQSNTCVSACSASSPYCKPCTTDLDCNSGFSTANHCLEDPRNAASCQPGQSGCQFWCGVDCSGAKACPAGFDCGSIIIVTQQTSCTCGTSCSNGTGPCQCNEGATSGFCLCTNDQECGAPLSGATCQSGYCTIGQNCFPSKGLYCDAAQCP